MGSNDEGQLGLDKDHVPVAVSPVMLTNLSTRNIQIDTVVCGFAHTLALSTDGKVLAWGSGKFG